ncbi:MAG: Minf_1886 family protein [Planctomycetota bacterium]
MVEIDLQAIASNSRYPLDAFVFVQRGLDYTVTRLHGEMVYDEPGEDGDDDDSATQDRHVSGRELCHGLRDFAVDQYGLMARTVLRRWGVTGCEDFGRIVFEMVEAGLMRRTEEDTFEDFVGVFDFRTAFTPELMLAEGS